ncbi:hypothetical protein FQA47_021204 [Oryzias melastigma]|uniref:Uncharacterized protein n=1 Tax=Oryzias melastigma TaxID=30732 RepID=A0A834CH71_ORYME|nr:hypothetical protein FQA47_021204 [Oryzias melastigma]
MHLSDQKKCLYSERKRHTDERLKQQSSCSSICSTPARKEGHSKATGLSGPSLRGPDLDASRRRGRSDGTGGGVRDSEGRVSKGDDNQISDVITSVTLLGFGISCKFSMQGI